MNKRDAFLTCLAAYAVNDVAVGRLFDAIFTNPTAPAVIDTAKVDDRAVGPAAMAYHLAAVVHGLEHPQPYVKALLG